MSVKGHHHGRSLAGCGFLHGTADERLMPEMNPVERPGRKDDGSLHSGKLPDGFQKKHRMSFIPQRRGDAEKISRISDDQKLESYPIASLNHSAFFAYLSVSAPLRENTPLSSPQTGDLREGQELFQDLLP